MQLLTGADAFQLYAESAVQPMHTLKVVVLDPAAGRPAPAGAALAGWLAAAADRAHPLRWRLVTAPLHFGGHGWVEEPTLDVSRHLHAATLEPPGDRAALDRLCGELMGGRLHRDRPLWELWIVDGLAGGAVAHVWKMHHALADGLSSVRLLEAIYQHSPDETGLPAGNAASGPSDAALPARVGWGIGLRRHARLASGLPDLLMRSRRARAVAAARRRAGLPAPARSRSGPATRFNSGLTERRCCATATLPLADMKAVSAATSTTLNDVYVAVVAGALREHLSALGELPDRPLTATLPVSTRAPGEELAYGNRLGVWYLPLPTHLADPVERLRAARVSTGGARETAAQSGAHRLLSEWQSYSVLFRPIAVASNAVRRSRAGRRLTRPLFNLTVSNVRGPGGRLYAAGAPVTEIVSMSVLSMGQGLNLTGWSYSGDFSIGLVGVPESDPHLPTLAERLEAELRLLTEAARSAAPNRLRSHA